MPRKKDAAIAIPAPLQEADWDDLLPRLRLFAHQFHRRYLSRIPQAPTPDDLVQEAVTKLYTGQRKLPDDVPLLTVLINNIQSDIWNFLTREGYTRKDSKGKARQGGGRHVALEAWMEDEDQGRQPADGVMRDWHEQIRARVDDDPLVLRIVELLFEDPKLKPRDLAHMLGTTVPDINKAQKRLRRRLKGLRDVNA